jgi:sugar phosphate isomerase/epimerase
LERNRLVLNQFPFFQPVVEGLTSPDAEQRKRRLDYFERGCVIARKLGAPMVNIVAPWARELSTPSTEYLPRYFMSDPKPGARWPREDTPVHVRDIDAAMREYVPIGRGVMDFQAIAGAVKAACRRYLRLMKQYLA